MARLKITPKLIRELGAACGEPPDFGVWRDRESVIINRKHRPPNRRFVPSLVREMCEYINACEDRIHAAAYAMWRINWIHPFRDGNGRTARTVATRISGSSSLSDHVRLHYGRYLDGLEHADAAWQAGKIDVSILEEVVRQSQEKPVSENNGKLIPMCGNCRFWVKAPPNRMDLADIRGECRKHPPQVTLIHVNTAQGPQVGGQSSAYPSLPSNYPICSEYQPEQQPEKPKIEVG